MHVEAGGQENPGQVPQGHCTSVGPWQSRTTQMGTNLRVKCKVNFCIWSAESLSRLRWLYWLDSYDSCNEVLDTGS